MIIIVNQENVVLNYGDSAERVDAQNEKGLIKVNVGSSKYYIGTKDRSEYVITEINSVELPVDFAGGKYLYVSGDFTLNPDYIEPVDEEF